MLNIPITNRLNINEAILLTKDGDTAEYDAKCLEYQKVNAEHKHTIRLLHPLFIVELEWEKNPMDFVKGLPTTVKKTHFIMVMVDTFTKVPNFIPVHISHEALDIVDFFLKVVRLYGIPQKVVSDINTKFTSNFWKSVFQAMGTQLNFRTIYHPQNGRNRKSEPSS
jgi:hypothetical protein